MFEAVRLDSTGNNVSGIVTTWTQRVLTWASQQEAISEQQLNGYLMETLPSSIPLDDSFGATRNIAIDAVRTHLESMGKNITVETASVLVREVLEEKTNITREKAQAIIKSVPVTPAQKSKPATVEVPKQKSISQEPSAKEPQHDDVSIENHELLEEVIAKVDLPEDSAESDMTLLNGTFHQVLDRTDKGKTDAVLDFSEEDGTFDLAEIDLMKEEVALPTQAKPGSLWYKESQKRLPLL